MTIGSLAPKSEKKGSRKNKAVVDENAPLLPKTHESDVGFDDFNGASFSSAVFNLSTTIIGAGIMALPATLRELGMVPGLIAIIFMALLTEKFVEVHICPFSCTSSCFSCHRCWNLNYKDISGGIGMPKLFPDATDMASVLKLFTVIPVFVTACICHYNVYVMISFFGFLLFGDGTLDDVLANFDTDLGIPFGSVLNDTVRLSYAAHLMLVFRVVFYPLRLNIDGLIFSKSKPLVLDNFRFGSLTIALIGVIFLGANFIPSIWDAFQFTGATAAVCLGFIFPAAIVLRDRYNITTKGDKILSVFMIVLAVFANAVAIYSDAYASLKQNKTSRE
ncbi:unnamed protein product [Lupinus luteus]|uniref:Amino acid transporter transmembrane domain-containing protein n=1 Tax=Lupinus luteus TaxID=3873 RepID=A0AAV1XUF3_LUPLU